MNGNKDTLILNNVSMQIKDPYENVPKCIYTPVSGDDCNPLELKCDARCQGTGICIMNPFSECYNMPMKEYQAYLDKINTACKEFLDSEEGKKLFAEWAETKKL